MDLTPATSPAAPATRSLYPLYAAHGMLHVLLGIYPAVLLLLRDQFTADYATLGAVYTAATLLYGVGSIPTGFIVNRVHPLTVVRAYLALAAIAAAVVAIAPGRLGMAAGILLLGLAGSPYHAAAMTLISRVSGNDPRLLAHHGMAGSIGLTAAPVFTVFLAALASWRFPFAVAAGVTVVILLWTLALPALPNLSATFHEHRSHVSLGRTHLPALALVYAITMALGFVFRGVATYLPALATQRADVFPGSGLVRGGILAGLVYAVGFFGQWWAAHLGHRPRLEAIYAALLAVQTLLLAAVVPSTGWLLVVLLLSYSVFHFTTQPLDNVLTGKYTSLHRRGVGYGFSFGLSFGVGSLAAWTGGLVADAAGDRLQYVFVLLAAVALVGTGCATALAVLSSRLQARQPPDTAPAQQLPDTAPVEQPPAAQIDPHGGPPPFDGPAV